MICSSNESHSVDNVVLKTLMGDTIEVERNRIADTAKAYFDTPFDEDVYLLPLHPTHMMMLHVPLDTQLQTYVTFTHANTTENIISYTIRHRLLDLQGRVYADNTYCMGQQVEDDQFVWLNSENEEVHLSPAMPSVAALAGYMASHLHPDSNQYTRRAVEIEREFLAHRLSIEWNRWHIHQELQRMRLHANKFPLDVDTFYERMRQQPGFPPLLEWSNATNVPSLEEEESLPVFRHLVSEEDLSAVNAVLSFTAATTTRFVNDMQTQCRVQ